MNHSDDEKLRRRLTVMTIAARFHQALFLLGLLDLEDPFLTPEEHLDWLLMNSFMEEY